MGISSIKDCNQIIVYLDLILLPVNCLHAGRYTQLPIDTIYAITMLIRIWNKAGLMKRSLRDRSRRR